MFSKVKRVKKGNKTGYRYGEKGRIWFGENAKQKAKIEGLAIEKSKEK